MPVGASSNPLVNLARAQFSRPVLTKPDQSSGSTAAMQSKLFGITVPAPCPVSSTVVAGHNLYPSVGPAYLSPGDTYTNIRYPVTRQGNIPLEQQRNATHANQTFGSVLPAQLGNRPSHSLQGATDSGMLRRGSGQALVPNMKQQDPIKVTHSQPQETRLTHISVGVTGYPYEGKAKENADVARSISQSSLEAMCQSPHDALEGFETASVISFASTAATHHDLDTKTDMVQSLLSMLGTHDKDDMSRTLLAMSNSRDSCAAMRQSGCLPLLIDLLHGQDFENEESRREARARAGLALHNIVYSHVDDRRGRREVRVLRLLEIVRAHCDVVRYKDGKIHACAARYVETKRLFFSLLAKVY